MEDLKNILIRNVTIIDSQSQYNGTKKDILIKDGFIKEIGTNIQFSDPFFEHAIVEYARELLSPDHEVFHRTRSIGWCH